MMRRNKQVAVRFSDAEFDLLQLGCRRTGLSQADLIARLLQSAAALDAKAGDAEAEAILQRLEEEAPARRGRPPIAAKVG